MLSEIFIHLLAAALFSVSFAQEVGPISDAADAAFPISSTTEIKFGPEPETTAPLPERSFPPEKSAETIAPRERGFPLPEIKPARELGAPTFAVPEHGHSALSPSATLPFDAASIDSDTTTVATAVVKDVPHYHKQQNATQEKIEHRETIAPFDPSATEAPHMDLMVHASTRNSDKPYATTKVPKYRTTEIEEDTLPPEVTAADPFATTTGEESVAPPTLQESPQLNETSPGANAFRSSSFESSPAVTLSSGTSAREDSSLQASTVNTPGSDSATFHSAASVAPSSVQRGYNTATTGATDGTVMASEISTVPVEVQRATEAAAPEVKASTVLSEVTAQSGDEHIQSAVWSLTSTAAAETTPDVFERTAASLEHTTEVPLLHLAASHTFRESKGEQLSTTEQSLNVRPLNAGETTVAEVTSTAEEHHTVPGPSLASSVELVPSITISESITRPPFFQEPAGTSRAEAQGTASVEAEQESALPTTTPTANSYGAVSTTANGFAAAESHEHEHEHEEENLFVGDKTLFSQDNTMKALQDFSTTRPASGFASQPEIEQTTEENFGVPGFSRVEGPGPEATEESHKPGTVVGTSHAPATTPSSHTGSEIRTGVSVEVNDEGESEFQERHDGEYTSVAKTPSATENPFEEIDEPKDISVTDDDSSHVHTGLEETANTFRPTTEEKPEPEPEPTPKPVLTTEGEVSEVTKESPEPGAEESADDSSGILHTHHTHVLDSGDAKEGTYKTPFSFRITSIDYTPEFGDVDSGKYKKLRDQLLPDLEEIFGSIFGHSYEGVHLVSFLKGSVVVDGIVYTSTKPDDMEQLATEFEQQVTAKNSQIGGNDVDPRSIALNGYVSKNYIERVHEGYTSGSTSSYIVGGGIAIGILAILLIAFAVIAMNNRRTNGTLKLKEENIAMAENGRSQRQNGTSPVNLMGYGNGRSVQGGLASNGQPPMVMIGSQVRPVHMHAATAAPPRP